MPFTFKLSKRLALMKASLVPAAAAVLAACQLQDRRGITGPTLPNNSVVQVVIVPDTVTLEPSQALQFLAYGRTEAGDSAGIAMTWSATDGAISSGGMYTASTFAGDYQVSAALIGAPQVGHSVVHVRSSSTLAQVVVVPRSTALGTGTTQQFSAYGRLSNGDSVAANGTWSATGGTISSSGLYQSGTTSGGYVVSASASGITGTAILAVSSVSVASVVMSPASATVSVGSTQQLSAVVKDANGNVLTGRTVTWASSNSAVATVSASGLVTGVAAGSATITATSEGKSASAAIGVANVPVASVVISPATAVVLLGATVQLAATPLDSVGSVLSGRTVTWVSSNPAVATVSATGLVTGVAASGVTITATSEGKAASAAVTVNPVPVASVAVSPAAASVSIGSTQQLSTVVKDASGSVLTGRTVTWVTSSSAVATVSSGGLVTGVATGTATIAATCEGQSGSTTVTVTNLAVASVTVSPAAPSVYVASSAQLTAIPKDANGNVLTGRTVTWATSNSTVATVSASGLVTGSAVGSATVTATSEGQNGTALATVSNVPVASVVVSPASANVLVGGTALLSATPKDVAGNVLAGRAVTWTSSNPAIATVSAAGLVTGVAVGSATITATSEGKSASAAISVSNVPVASVVISPAAAVVLVGATVQLTATLKDSAGNVLSGRSVTWASSAPAVATVSSTGLVTGVAASAVTITATSEGKTGSAAVTVNPVPVASVSISPASASVMVGQTVQFTATPKDANGNPLSGRTVTWASSALGVATVSTGGLVTGVAAGSATISATSQGTTGSATVTVSLVPVASVTVSPVTAVVLVGATVQLAATVLDSAGNVLSGRSVTWATSAAAVATVSSTGLVSGVAAGAVTITATSGGKTASAAATVNPLPVASVTVSPASASVSVGSTQQLTAVLKDANGNVLTGRTVTWASSAPGVAAVSTGGLVTGVGTGSVTITATSEGKSGTAAIAVTASSCVTSAGAWQNSAMAAQSGTFEAQFDVTPATANMAGVVGLSNGPAADWTALAGIVAFEQTGMIDARNGGAYAAIAAIPYSAATTYHFRLDVNLPAHTYDIYVTPAGSPEQLLGSTFAFRTEQATVSVLNNLGLDAAVGSATVCNLAIAAWTPPPPAPVASVTVSPAAASVAVGSTVQLIATPKDANGTPLSGRVVTWSSGASTLAAVTGTGLVTGLALGSATITATSEGQSGTTATTITASPSDPAYYVSPSGSDAVSCAQAQNIATPKQTVNNAVGCLTPGTTLLIRGGTYAEALIGNIPSGTSWTAPVTLKAYPGETVILKPSATFVLFFQNAQAYIVIDGLILDGSNISNAAVKITYSGSDRTTAAHHIRLRNGEIKNAATQGVLADGGSNEFINLQIHNNGGPVGSTNLNHGMYIESSNNLVDGCDLYNNATFGIVFYYSSGGGVNNNTIRNTKIHGNNKGLLISSGSGNTAYNNVLYGNLVEGFDVEYSASNTTVYQNTVYQNGSGIYNGADSFNATFRNNLSYLNGFNYADVGSGTLQDHNLFGVDPKFGNPAAGDFHLQLGSPAIDTGATITTVTTDFDGVLRPHGAAYDIGAFEY